MALSLKDLTQRVTQFFNPTSNAGNNFWSSGVAQRLGSAQEFVEQGVQRVRNQPISSFFFPASQTFQQPIQQTVQRIPQPLRQAFVNTQPAVKFFPQIKSFAKEQFITQPRLQAQGIIKTFRPQYGVKTPEEQEAFRSLSLGVGLMAGNVEERLANTLRQGIATALKKGHLNIEEARELFKKLPQDLRTKGRNLATNVRIEDNPLYKGTPAEFTPKQLGQMTPQTRARLTGQEPEHPFIQGLIDDAKKQADIPIIQKKPKAQIRITQQEVDEAQTRAAMQELKTETLKGRWNRVFAPIKNQTGDIQESFMVHDASKKIAKIDANQLAMDFKSNLNPKLEWRLVQFSQNPTAETARVLKLTPQELGKGDDLIRKSLAFNDAIFSKAKAAGVELNYRQNHIYQLFKESPEKIDNIIQASGLGTKPGFAHTRRIPTFREGVEQLSLTPRYSTFGQLNAAAQESLDRAIANQQLVNSLKQSGQLLPESKAPVSWEAITAKFFPKERITVGLNQSIEQSYKAPPPLAKFINNYFGGQVRGVGDVLLSGTAKVSHVAQDVVLSGGIGPLNFFGIGQIVKEGTAGRFTTPLMAFFRAYLPGASKAFEKANYGVIREMASQGISVRGVTNYQKIYKNIADKNSITEVIGAGWQKVINEPTFGKLLTQLQIGFYKDSKRALLKKGLPEKQVIQVAADATKKFYGVSDTIGRAEGVSDALTTIFLAPRYRESMVNIFAQFAGLLKPTNWLKAQYQGIRNLAVGMVFTYGLYNVAQKNLTDNYLWQNPPGKEFELVIPVGDPKDKKFISIPWMPGFTAVPRRVVSGIWATVKGDIKEGVRQFGSLWSIPISRMFELIANKDYFGNEIIREGTQAQDLAAFGIKSLLPGYGRGAFDIATKRATPAFGVVEALELPIRKGTFPNPYFTAKDEVMKNLTKEEKQQVEYLLTADKAGGPDSTTEARMMLANEKLLEAKKQIMLASSPNHPLYSRSDTDIKLFLAYRTTDDTALKAKIRVAAPWIPNVQEALNDLFYSSQMEKRTPTQGYDPSSTQGRLGRLLNPPKPITEPLPERRPVTPMQQLTEQQVQIASAYTASPKGSAQRRQLLAQNPWLKDYWQANEDFYAANPFVDDTPMGRFLASQGIYETPQGTFKAYAKKPKKIRIKFAKTKPFKLKAAKPGKIVGLKKSKTFTVSKMPKIKKYTASMLRPYKIPKYRNDLFRGITRLA